MHLSDVPNQFTAVTFAMRIGSPLKFLLLVLFVAIALAESDSAGVGSVTAMESLTQRGERALQDLQVRSKTNECWRSALLSVVSTCRSLTEERRVHFAVALANCHLAAAALPTAPCTTGMSIAECTKPLTTNPMAFNTYTEFYLAIDSMCYSLQREEVQARMEATAAQLLDAGTRSAGALNEVTGQLNRVADQQKQLSDSQAALLAAHTVATTEVREHLQALKSDSEETTRELQQVVLLGQKLRIEQGDTLAAVERVRAHQHTLATLTEAAIAAQERLSEQQVKHAEADRAAHAHLQSELAHAAKTSAAARASLEELGQAQILETNKAMAALAALATAAAETHRRQEKLSEVLERIEGLQSVLAAEFLDTHRVAFYASAFALLILLTSARRLAALRTPCLLLLAVSFAIERNATRGVWHALGIQLHWLVRTVFVACTALLFSAQVWRYQDEATRLRQLVSDQTQQTLVQFFAASSEVSEREMAREVPVARRPASRPRRRLLPPVE